MSEVSKYTVPEEGLKATVEAMKNPSGTKFLSTEQWASLGLEAFIRWQSENPIVPTEDQSEELRSNHYRDINSVSFVRSIVVKWQRRMYLAPEPEVPEEIKDLLYNKYATSPPFERHNNLVIEAYRRGQKSK